jgi:hypothetical protein
VVAKYAVPGGKLSALTPDRVVPDTPQPSPPDKEEKPDDGQPQEEPQKDKTTDRDNEEVEATADVPKSQAQKTSWSISWR